VPGRAVGGGAGCVRARGHQRGGPLLRPSAQAVRRWVSDAWRGGLDAKRWSYSQNKFVQQSFQGCCVVCASLPLVCRCTCRSEPTLRHSSGMHISLPAYLGSSNNTGMIIPKVNCRVRYTYQHVICISTCYTQASTPPSPCPTHTHVPLHAQTSDGRVVFMLPWQGHVIAGTTDIACEVRAA
jgi:hypothetical protein